MEHTFPNLGTPENGISIIKLIMDLYENQDARISRRENNKFNANYKMSKTGLFIVTKPVTCMLKNDDG